MYCIDGPSVENFSIGGTKIRMLPSNIWKPTLHVIIIILLIVLALIAYRHLRKRKESFGFKIY